MRSPKLAPTEPQRRHQPRITRAQNDDIVGWQSFDRLHRAHWETSVNNTLQHKTRQRRET